MATEHNALKFFVGLTRGLKRLYGVDDSEQGTTRVTETLDVCANPWERPEWAFPIGVLRWSAQLVQAATAAENSFCGINNNSSEFITVVLRFLNDANVSVPQSQWFLIPPGSVPAFTGTGTPNPLDSRILVTGGVTAIPVQSVIHHQAGAIAGSFSLGRSKWNASAGIQWVDVGVVLLPGAAFVVEDLTANDNLSLTIEGYTYRANPGELLRI